MKKLLQSVFILFLLLGFTNCSCQKPLSQLPEAIEEVYFQNWIGGQESTGSGTNLHLKFKNPLPKDTYLKKVFFQNQEADFVKENETAYVARFYDKAAHDLILDGNAEKEYGNEPPKDKQKTPDFPYDLKPTEAVLEFQINNKVSRVKIENIKEKELLAYPAAPRN